MNLDDLIEEEKEEAQAPDNSIIEDILACSAFSNDYKKKLLNKDEKRISKTALGKGGLDGRTNLLDGSLVAEILEENQEIADETVEISDASHGYTEVTSQDPKKAADKEKKINRFNNYELRTKTAGKVKPDNKSEFSEL